MGADALLDADPGMIAYLAPVLEAQSVEAPILRQVPPPLLGEIWPRVAERIEAVVQRSGGRWSIPIIAKQLVTGQWQLWVVWNGEAIAAVIATEIYTEDTGMKLARVLFTTGDGAREWVHLLADIEVWALDQGAVRLEMMARKGWAKHLPEYKMSHVLLEKDLRHG